MTRKPLGKRGPAGGHPEVVDGDDCRMEHACALERLSGLLRLSATGLCRVAERMEQILANDQAEEAREAQVRRGLAGLARDLLRHQHYCEAHADPGRLAEQARGAARTAGELHTALAAALQLDLHDDPLQEEAIADARTLASELSRNADRMEKNATLLRQSDLRGEEDRT